MASDPKTAEEKTEAALKILVAQHPLFVGYHPSRKNGEVDSELTTDFVVLLSNQFAILLQVKKTEDEVEKHRKNHPHNPAIKISKADTIDAVATRIESLALAMIESVKVHKVEKNSKIPGAR